MTGVEVVAKYTTCLKTAKEYDLEIETLGGFNVLKGGKRLAGAK